MKLKKENEKMILFHPKKGEMDLSKADNKTLLALSKEKGYDHLFEEPKKDKK